MLNFLKNLIESPKPKIVNNGEAITVSDKLEFERKLRHHNESSIDDDLKTMFHLILDKLFRKMEPELLSSFLTKIKLKYHKNQELERDEKGELYLISNPYTNIYRERRLDNIKTQKISVSSNKAVIPYGKMVYLDMIFTSLVETNKNKAAGSERSVAYKTPIRVYMIVDDDFISHETADGEWLHKSVGFLRFGIILPEFSSLNLQTKTIPNTVLRLPYLYAIQNQRITSPNIRHFEIFLKRFKNDKEVSKYMKEDDTEGLYSEKIEEFINLFKLIHQAKSTIFRIKDNERFCDWMSCDEL